MRKQALFCLSLVVTLLFASACADKEESSQADSSGPGRLKVVATTAVLADFARVVGGDKVDVYNVIKPGTDPHEYEPTPADLAAIGGAKVVLKNGVGLEHWFDDTLKNVDSKATVVDTSTGATIRQSGDAADKAGDPHIWHSIPNAKLMVANVTAAFTQADGAHKADFESNQRAYVAELDALEKSIRQSIEALVNKKIVTNHDSLGYFIDEFGLQFVGSIIPSFDTQAELSSTQVTDIVNKIKEQGVKAVFAESSVPKKTAETIAKEAGVKIVDGDESLFGDSLGAAGSDGDTYLKMERHNADVIVDNLK